MYVHEWTYTHIPSCKYFPLMTVCSNQKKKDSRDAREATHTYMHLFHSQRRWGSSCLGLIGLVHHIQSLEEHCRQQKLDNNL